MELSHADLLSRRAFDWRVLAALQSPTLGAVRAYASHHSRSKRLRLAEAEGTRGLAQLYEVDFTFPMLTAPGEVAHAATFLFDASDRSYPYERPTVTCLTSPRPYSTHVNSTGVVCLGDFWRKDRLLAQLVVHVMKIVNLDEPLKRMDGYSLAAYEYWRDALGRKPYVRNLAYPALPVSITHGSAEVRPMFSFVDPTVFADAGDLPQADLGLFEEVAR